MGGGRANRVGLQRTTPCDPEYAFHRDRRHNSSCIRASTSVPFLETHCIGAGEATGKCDSCAAALDAETFSSSHADMVVGDAVNAAPAAVDAIVCKVPGTPTSCDGLGTMASMHC